MSASKCRYFFPFLISLYALYIVIDAFYDILTLIGLDSLAGTFENPIFRLIGYTYSISILIGLYVRFKTFNKIFVIQ